MKVKFVWKRVLLVAIVLLSLAWLGQPAMAGDNDECAPLIKALNIYFSEEGNSISIMGMCFGKGDPPKVTLCGVELPVKHNTETTIDSILVHDPAAVDCALMVCTDDELDACDRFWIAAPPYGPEGQLPSYALRSAMQWVGIADWTSVVEGSRPRCWKRCNPNTKPHAIRYCGRWYKWVCDCSLPKGCCHWAPPILPLCREDR